MALKPRYFNKICKRTVLYRAKFACTVVVIILFDNPTGTINRYCTTIFPYWKQLFINISRKVDKLSVKYSWLYRSISWNSVSNLSYFLYCKNFKLPFLRPSFSIEESYKIEVIVFMKSLIKYSQKNLC